MILKISHEAALAESPESNSFDMAADDSSVRCGSSSSRSCSTPQTGNVDKMFHRSDSVPFVTNRLIEMLDHVEKRVEMLREHASAMEQERDNLLSMINTIQTNKDLRFVSEGEREEIEITAQRLMYRTLTVEVTVTTPRNENQQKALDQVKHYIDTLLVRIKSDLDGSKRSCEEYLNACLPDARGPIDQKFQAAIIECTADDQKKTRKRLESLLTSIIHAEGSIHH